MKKDLLAKYALWLRILYPVWIIIGITGYMYIPSLFVFPGDGPATVKAISEGLTLYKTGIMIDILNQFVFLAVALLLYKVFCSVSKTQASLMLLFVILSIPIALYNVTNKLDVLSVLEQPDLAMLYLHMYDLGLAVVTIFWGIWLFPLALLVLRSNYLPRFTAYALLLGGIGHLGLAIAELMGLHVIDPLFEVLTFGELIFILVLIFRGMKIKSMS